VVATRALGAAAAPMPRRSRPQALTATLRQSRQARTTRSAVQWKTTYTRRTTTTTTPSASPSEGERAPHPASLRINMHMHNKYVTKATTNSCPLCICLGVCVLEHGCLPLRLALASIRTRPVPSINPSPSPTLIRAQFFPLPINPVRQSVKSIASSDFRLLLGPLFAFYFLLQLFLFSRSFLFERSRAQGRIYWCLSPFPLFAHCPSPIVTI